MIRKAGTLLNTKEKTTVVTNKKEVVKEVEEKTKSMTTITMARVEEEISTKTSRVMTNSLTMATINMIGKTISTLAIQTTISNREGSINSMTRVTGTMTREITLIISLIEEMSSSLGTKGEAMAEEEASKVTIRGSLTTTLPEIMTMTTCPNVIQSFLTFIVSDNISYKSYNSKREYKHYD